MIKQAQDYNGKKRFINCYTDHTLLRNNSFYNSESQHVTNYNRNIEVKLKPKIIYSNLEFINKCY